MAITFKSVLSAARAILQSKTVTAGTSDITVQPDSGYDGLSQVTVEPTPSTAITPSDSSPASMTSGQRYTPGANGYAIESYASITPTAAGAEFSAGINKMSAGGYAYTARPSGGVLRTIKSNHQTSTNNNFTNSQNLIDCTGFSNYQNWSTDNFLVCPRIPSNYFLRAQTNNSSESGTKYANGTFNFRYLYTPSTGKLGVYCYEHASIVKYGGSALASNAIAIPIDVYYYES